MTGPKNNLLPTVILVVIYAATLVFGILLFIAPPPIYPDPSWGFMVMRKMEQGGAFNMLVRPDPRDLSKDYHEFLSWWSPGQYLIPYLFRRIFSINIGQAVAITVTFCQFVGLAGFYKFCRKAGFNSLLSALAILFIACQQFYIIPYTFYNGGEVLVFAFAGWFLYGCVSMEKADWKLAVFTLFAGWIGFFCKSSMMWVYVAGGLFVWINLSANRPVREWIKNGLFIAIPAAIAVGTIAVFYLAKGDNPSADTSGLNFTLTAFCFPLASPLLSGFSVDDLFNGLIYHNDRQLINDQWSLMVLALLAILSVVVIIAVIRRTPNNQYRLMLAVFYIISVLFFTGGFLRGANISYEARHFRVIGLLIIPGALYCITQLKRLPQIAFAALTLFIGVFSYRAYIKSVKYNRTHALKEDTGIVQPFIDQQTLDFIRATDQKYHDAIFTFLSPDLGLEVNNNRVTILDPIGPDVKIDFDEYVQKGHAGPVFLLIPRDYYGPKMNMLMKCYPGYKGFTMASITNNYLVLTAKDAR